MPDTRARGSDKRGRVVGAVFSAVFLLIGGGLLVPFFLVPMAKVWQARRWSPVGCEIVSSGVGGGGDTYRVDVLYRYQVGGVRYTGSRAEFLGGESSGREEKQRRVDHLVPGSTVPCWVDPRRPDQSVLDRGLSADMWFAVIPGIFALIGLLGLYGTARGVPAQASSWPKSAADEPPPEALVGPESRLLTPELSPRARFFGAVFVALFWNGCTQFLVRDVIAGWQTGQRPIFSTLFALPFVAIGVVLVVLAGHKLLAIWNPRPLLSVRPGRLVAGERADLDWELTGAVDRLRRLTLSLEGREVTPAKSSDSKEVTSVFTTVPIHSDDLIATARRGSARFHLPADSRPSSLSRDRKIVWVVKMHGEIPGWPDLREEFVVGVLPANPGQAVRT